MLNQYYIIIRCRYEANANIANGNPILANVAWQDNTNANANIANGKPTLGQYIHVVLDNDIFVGQDLNLRSELLVKQNGLFGIIKTYI